MITYIFYSQPTHFSHFKNYTFESYPGGIGPLEHRIFDPSSLHPFYMRKEFEENQHAHLLLSADEHWHKILIWSKNIIIQLNTSKLSIIIVLPSIKFFVFGGDLINILILETKIFTWSWNSFPCHLRNWEFCDSCTVPAINQHYFYSVLHNNVSLAREVSWK